MSDDLKGKINMYSQFDDCHVAFRYRRISAKPHCKDQRGKHRFGHWNLVPTGCGTLGRSISGLVSILHFQCWLMSASVAVSSVGLDDLENIGVIFGMVFCLFWNVICNYFWFGVLRLVFPALRGAVKCSGRMFAEVIQFWRMRTFALILAAVIWCFPLWPSPY